MAPPLPTLGIMLWGLRTPDNLVDTARRAERAGFAEIWVSEDYFCGGGIATAATVLAATTLPVGLGLAPVAGRHPAVLAMETASLAGLHPGRFALGVGAGVPDWVAQLGLTIRSPLRAVRDTLDCVRGLLAGNTVTTDSELFVARDIRLAHPPATPPALYLGAGGPKMLAVSARHADGTVLSVLSGPRYVRWARARLADAGAERTHRMVVFAFCAVDDDREQARESLREMVAAAALPGPRNPLSEQQGFADEAERLAALPWDQAVAGIPDSWLATLTVSGTMDDCQQAILELGMAGADAVALCFAPGHEHMIERIGPLLSGA